MASSLAGQVARDLTGQLPVDRARLVEELEEAGEEVVRHQ